MSPWLLIIEENIRCRSSAEIVYFLFFVSLLPCCNAFGAVFHMCSGCHICAAVVDRSCWWKLCKLSGVMLTYLTSCVAHMGAAGISYGIWRIFHVHAARFVLENIEVLVGLRKGTVLWGMGCFLMFQ